MNTITNESNTKDLVEELRQIVDGEVRFDKMSRQLYSTDASIYQIEPIGVVIPKTSDDVIAVIETANKYKLPVLPRGGGTSLAGQTVGEAIVIDFSKYMRNVLQINAEERWVKTQPGIILDELNHHLLPYGLLFAPDPSTSNRGNVGGALGNNSCGAHSIVWGKTSDNIHDLNVILANGQTTQFGTLNDNELKSKMSVPGLEGDIYRRLHAIGKANIDEIKKRYPTIQRRVSGYNLDEFTTNRNFDMARFVVGSEGTLVTITEATLKVVPRPRMKALAVIHFKSLLESMEATVATLELGPAAVELIGSMILRQAKSNLEYSRMMDFIDGDPEAILVVEVTGETESDIEMSLNRLDQQMKKFKLGYSVKRLTKASDQSKVWAVRKAGLGLMMNVPGNAKPLPFVEDTAVSPEKLPEFVRRFDDIIRQHGTEAGYYGHASVGCLHIRPLIDLKAVSGVERMTSISTSISDLVLEFGGSMSGEHGDGLVRSIWNEKMFGSKIYAAFKEVKTAFDPHGIMNPGKIVDSPPMTNNLRIDPSYRPRQIETSLFLNQERTFETAVEMCNGQGACRKVIGGTMCPSYMVTRDEEHSTRGRANALRAAISGALPIDSITSKRMFNVMELCLECKACKAECPSNVDVAKLKYEFLAQYRNAHGESLRDKLFGNIGMVNRWGSFFTPVSNWALQSAVFRDVLDEHLGIDRRRTIPSLANQTFVQWFRTRRQNPLVNKPTGQVILFPDTFTNYNHPNLGIAATKVIEAMGYEVILPSVLCCGRPMLAKGMMDKARANAQINVNRLYNYVRNGAWLVGLEPSCILSFKDDYLDLLGNDPKAKEISVNTMLIEEFVQNALNEGAKPQFKNEPTGRVLFHGHCHQKALIGTEPAMTTLKSIPGCAPEEIDAGCCGMAGSFGFEKEHYDISMKIGEQSLFPTIRSQTGNFQLVAEGVSCRQQIEHGTKQTAKHLVEILADAL